MTLVTDVMSALPILQSQELLRSLMSSDNGIRGQAEEAFNTLKKTPDTVVLTLLQILCSTDDHGQAVPIELRIMSSVLLRRVLMEDEVSLWPQCSAQTQNLVKSKILQTLMVEKDRGMRRKLCDIVGEIAAALLEEQQWPELLPFLLQCVNDSDADRQETALRIFSMVADVIAANMRGELPTFFRIFERCLQVNAPGAEAPGQPVASPHVCAAAVRALGMLVISLSSSKDRKAFQPLLGNVISVLRWLCAQVILGHDGVEAEMQECFEVLIDIAEEHPVFYKTHLSNLLDASLAILLPRGMNDLVSSSDRPGTSCASMKGYFLASESRSCGQLALELLVTLAESSAPMCRKLPNNEFPLKVISTTICLMLDIDEDPQWVDKTEEEDFDDLDIGNYDVAEEALDRLARALGGKKTLPVAFELLPKFMDSPNWQYRHAALMALSQISEVMTHDKKELKQVAERVVHFLSDGHPRVVYAAINVIGQMSIDHGPTLQNETHALVIPSLLNFMSGAVGQQARGGAVERALETRQVPRVLSHAAAALVNFVDMCEAGLLAPYLEQILSVLFMLVRDGHIIVKEQAITAIASVADAGGSIFGKYYHTFMPLLKTVLVECKDKESRLLRGKSLEAMSLIWLAVGRDVAYKDIMEVMEYLVHWAESTQMESDDPQRSYLLQAWARVCKCLGKEFARFLPLVMPSLIEAATQQAEFTLSEASGGGDGGAEGAEGMAEDDEDVEIVESGDTLITVRTSALEEKASACRIITSFVHDLQEAFFPYVEQVTKIMAPLITESVHEDIRSSAIAIMPDLVLATSRALRQRQQGGGSEVDQRPAAVLQLLNFALGRLLESLATEADAEVVMTAMQAIKICVENASQVQARDTHSGEGDAHASKVEPVFEPVLNGSQIQQLLGGLIGVFGDIFRRRAMRRAKQKVDDYDEEEEEKDYMESSTDQELQFILADTIGSLAKTHKEVALQVFQNTLFDKILEMAQPYCLAEDRKMAVFIMDDVLEYCGPSASAHVSLFVPVLLQGCEDSDFSLRQASAYGLGVCARLHAEALRPWSARAAETLAAAVRDPQGRSGERETATDNAASALGLLLFHGGLLSATAGAQTEAQELARAWLSYLPLRADREESRAVTQRLCRLVDAGDARLFGPKAAHLPRVLGALADSLEMYGGAGTAAGTGKEDQALLQELRRSLLSLKAQVPHPILEQCWAQLSAPQRKALAAFV